MTVHIYHEDIHDVGLIDGCDRCAEHGQSIHGLDARMLANLQDRIQSGLPGRSFNESEAMQRLIEHNRPVTVTQRWPDSMFER